jgi:signal transduction histidine kinase
VSFCAIQPGLLLEALFGLAPREIGFEIFSRPIVSSSLWLNPSGRMPRAIDPAFRPYLKTNFALPVANQTWSLHCYTTPLFEREASLSRPWVVLPLGLGLTVALTALMAIQVRAHIRQSAVAAELRSACDDLQRVQSERERVSRELHDGAIQSLFLLQLTLGRCERLFSANPTQARELLARSKLGIDDLIAELRRFLLRDDAKPAEPVSFEEARSILQHLAERFRSTESMKVQMTGATYAPMSITRAQLQHLRQIAQEAMSNSLRHSQARKLSLDLAAAEGSIRLTIADDGQGFDQQAPAATGNGIANMQARAVHMGGNLKIESCPGRGTSVTLTFPASATSPTHHEQAATHQTSDR